VPEEHLLGAPKARRISLDGPSWISWSPDNKRLLYIDSFFNVKVISVTGGEPLLLTRLEKLDYISPAWAPDSASVALIGEQLMVFDAFTGKKRILTDTPNHMLTWMYNDIQYVSWSPDGKRLLFSKNYGLSMIAMDGTGERKIVTGSAAEPLSWGRWSPDGTMISYLRSGRSSTSKVMLQKLGGNVGNEVARDVLVTSGVIWSANGNYLIFVNNGTQVTILNLANQVKYELTGLKGSGYSVIETRWRNGLP
jgi:Tol biopolymer transport system component